MLKPTGAAASLLVSSLPESLLLQRELSDVRLVSLEGRFSPEGGRASRTAAFALQGGMMGILLGLAGREERKAGSLPRARASRQLATTG
jgi:hypothetical protein